jgi:translation initiation factor 4B
LLIPVSRSVVEEEACKLTYGVAKDRADGGGAREFRDLDWGARRGPLEDLPGQARRGGGDFGDRRGGGGDFGDRRGGGGDFGDRRGGGDFGDRRGGGDFADRRPPREPQADDGKVRDLGNWERKGPLSPVPQPERSESRDGSRAPRPLEAGRSESYRGGARRASPAAWGGSGEAHSGDGSRPPRREFAERPERPERVPTAADKDMQWRTSMRPDLATKSPVQSREGSEAPPSPAGGAPAQPAGRPKLNLAKRTVSEAPAIVSPALSVSDSKANPFGAARPIDTAAREKLIEEKRVQALKEKKEADDKAKEDRRLAKEAAAKEAADKAEAEAAAKAEAEAAEAAEAAKPKAEPKAEPEAVEETVAASDASGDQKLPVRPREPKEPRDNVANPKSRATDSGNWRTASGGDRGDRGAPRGAPAPSGPRRGGGAGRGGALGGRSESGRGPRANGTGPAQPPQSPVVDQAPSTPKPEDDGWTTVAPVSKGRRGGR